MIVLDVLENKCTLAMVSYRQSGCVITGASNLMETRYRKLNRVNVISTSCKYLLSRSGNSLKYSVV